MSSQADRLLSRRKLLSSAALLSLAAALPGCSPRPSALTVAASPWLGYEFLFLAARQGWMDPELVKLNEMPSNAASIEAMRDGLVDAAALTLAEVLQLRDTGLELSVVLVLTVSAGAGKLLTRRDIKTAQQARGQRIGYRFSSHADLLVAQFLKHSGLDFKDLVHVNLLEGDQLGAWLNREADLIVAYSGDAKRLEMLGAIPLFDTSQMPNMMVDVLAVRSERLRDAQFTAALQQLTRGQFTALQQFQASPWQTSSLMDLHLGLTIEEVVPAYQGIRLPDRAENLMLLGGDSPYLVKGAMALGDTLQDLRLINGPVSVEHLVSSEFL